MTYRRRQFLKTTAGLTLGGLTASVNPFTPLFAQKKGQASVAILWEEGFGRNEVRNISKTELQRALSDHATVFLTAQQLTVRLSADDFDLLVMPFGSHFPQSSYPAILRFLRSGGNLLNIGGTPFSVPWTAGPNGWAEGIAQVNYHKELGITQSFRTIPPANGSIVLNAATALNSELIDAFQCTAVHELYYRFADTNDFPNESGTTGTQDAAVTPLLWMTDDAGERRTAPFIQVDHLRGSYSGGRWILVTMEGSIEPAAVKQLAVRALGGTVQLHANPGYACYRKGELPIVHVKFRYPAGNAAALLLSNCTVRIHHATKKNVSEQTVALTGSGGLLIGELMVDRKTADGLTPGLYQVSVEQRIQREHLPAEALTYSTGFWIYDESLMNGGAVYTTDGDYFLKGGKPYPVAGTTYMTSDVHRKFLFEPNAWVWHNDFSAMNAAGINMVRTGIWTAWRNYMLDPGTLNETTMRSLDAFLLTARTFDIPVIFTFFAFLPELWNGENAYLDPRSVTAQKEFVGLIVRRYRGMNDVMWDLINEPSFCSPQNLWSCRPNYDRFEQQAWSAWLTERYPNRTASEREDLLRAQYRLRPDESTGLPAMGDFSGSAILYDKRPLKTVDYKFFAQAMFTRWSAVMVDTIRENGNPKQLITVGQDEAGTGDSPSPHFFSGTVDFTSLHNWWLNDDLVWDSVMTKVHGKANLIEETGVMFYEKADGSAFRTEQEAAQLLDRKIAISLGTGGAGFIQWIWNINPLMKNDNEATIGLVRADGTVKPEFDVVKKYAAFIRKHRQIFTGREDETAVMLIPHSQIFSARNSASEATKRAVRMLTYQFGIPVRTVAEHADSALLAGARLIVVPSPRTLSDNGWKLLTEAANAGATVMISGIIDDDPFFISRQRSAALRLTATSSVITQEEMLHIGDTPYRFSFRGDKIQQLEKADLSPEKKQEVIVTRLGKGTIMWSPVPVENSESPESLSAYYAFALKNAGVTQQFSVNKKDASILLLPQNFERHVLYTLVSETNEDTSIEFSHGKSGIAHAVLVPAQGAVLLIVDRATGTLVGRSDRS